MRVDVSLKQHEICMGLDVPDMISSRLDQKQNNASKPCNNVLLSHIDFKACIQPETPKDDGFHKQCTAEVNAIRLFFPGIRSEPILIVFSAWLGFACVMDDTLETLSPKNGAAVLRECIGIIKSRPHDAEAPTIDNKIQYMTYMLRDQALSYLPPRSADAFFQAVGDVFRAHIDETRFVQGLVPRDMSTYMSIRCRTISLNPFFEVVKTEYLPGDKVSHPIWERLQHAVSCAAGLQNDLIGLERDIENGEELNAVVVLMRGQSMRNIEEPYLAKQVDLVLKEHNASIARAIELASAATQIGQGAEALAVNSVVEHIVLLARTHLMWCASAKRYQPQVRSEVY